MPDAMSPDPEVVALAEALRVGLPPKRVEDYRPEEFYADYATAVIGKLHAAGYRVVAAENEGREPTHHEIGSDPDCEWCARFLELTAAPTEEERQHER